MNKEEKKLGAPAEDETASLFVTSRKKQLADQESHRLAVEEETRRLATEEEVRKLEAEVVERKRKAEEEAKLLAANAGIEGTQDSTSNPGVFNSSKPTVVATTKKIVIWVFLSIIVLFMIMILLSALGHFIGDDDSKTGDKSDAHSSSTIRSETSIASQNDSNEESSLVIDSDADLNSNAIIESLGMILHYPDTLFEVSSLTEEGLMLSSLDGAAVINVMNGGPCGRTTEENFTIHKDAALNELLDVVYDYSIINSSFYLDGNDIPFTYFDLTYSREDQTRYLYFISSAWLNEHTDEAAYCDFALDCPLELKDDYFALFERIRSSRDDS